MNPADIHTLTGAYAVDALPEDERERFERHLAECAACELEVRELQATAARLGAAEHVQPPASLKRSVMEEIARTRQEAPRGTTRDRVPTPPTVLPPPWHQRVLAPAAAVLVVVVIGLSAVIANLNSRLAELETFAAPVADVLTAPDVITLAAAGPGGSSMRLIASPLRGEGVFLVDGMAGPPSERVYQLWLLRDGEAIPAGLLDVDERGRGAHVMTGDMSEVAAVAITVEPDGGSPQPTSDPIARLELPSA
jgi:anti-sigma-K factor RskA